MSTETEQTTQAPQSLRPRRITPRRVTTVFLCCVAPALAACGGTKQNGVNGTSTAANPGQAASNAQNRVDQHLTKDQIAIQNSLEKALRQDLPAPTTGIGASVKWLENMRTAITTQSGRAALEQKTAQDFVKDYAGTPEGRANHIDPNDKQAVAAVQGAIHTYLHQQSFSSADAFYKTYKAAGKGQAGVDAVGKQIAQQLTGVVNKALAVHVAAKGNAHSGASVGR